MKINGSSWKFAVIFIVGLVIAAQLIFIIYWRSNKQHQKHWRTSLPKNWVREDVEKNSTKLFAHENSLKKLKVDTSTLPEAKSSDHVDLRGKPDRFLYDLVEPYKPKQFIQEMLCPKKDQESCYIVLDGPSRFGNGFARSLVREPAVDVMLTESDLKFPEDYKFSRANSRNWPVKMNEVTVDYMKLIVTQPFVSKTFPESVLSSQKNKGLPMAKKKRILSIGLHSTSVNNFFANLSMKFDVTVVESEPILKYLAEKWFGLEESRNHKVIIEDPAKFLAYRSRAIEAPFISIKAPKKFDLIVVDTCRETAVKELKIDVICPKSEFSDPTVVDNLRKNLADNGTILLHLFSIVDKNDIQKNQTLAKYKHALLQLYQKHFKNCYFVKIGANVVLTCAPAKLNKMTQHEWRLEMEKLPMSFRTYSEPGLNGPKIFIDTGTVEELSQWISNH